MRKWEIIDIIPREEGLMTAGVDTNGEADGTSGGGEIEGDLLHELCSYSCSPW